MSFETPGYRLLFIDDIEYEDLLLRLTPVVRTVVEDSRVWMYTKSIAGRMRLSAQNEQRAKDLLDFIHDRRRQSKFIALMWSVLQDQTDLIGCVREEPGTFETFKAPSRNMVPTANLSSTNVQAPMIKPWSPWRPPTSDQKSFVKILTEVPIVYDSNDMQPPTTGATTKPAVPATRPIPPEVSGISRVETSAGLGVAPASRLEAPNVPDSNNTQAPMTGAITKPPSLAVPATFPIPHESTGVNHVETSASLDVPHYRDTTRLESMSANISFNSPLHNTGSVFLSMGTAKQAFTYATADMELLLVRRKNKEAALYQVVQTEIKYGADTTQVPYSILAFRLEKGKDVKQCLQVKLTGRFSRNDSYKRVNVKDLWHTPRKENELTKVQSQITSTGQFQVQAGFNGCPVGLVNVGGSKSVQSTLTRGQRIDVQFNDFAATFEVNLALDDGIAKNLRLSVAESVSFFVVLKLEEFRQPMQLELKAAVTYVSDGRLHKAHAHVEARTVKDYSGNKLHDIIKIPPKISTA